MQLSSTTAARTLALARWSPAALDRASEAGLRAPQGPMETWRKGSFRSPSFFKRLSLGRPRRLRRQGSVLSQASTAGGDHEEYSNREVIRELRGRPDGRRLPLWGDEQPRATLLAPPKPPRLYRESFSCPNILEAPSAEYTAAYSATLPSALSVADNLHRSSEEDLTDTPPFQRTPAPDLSDPFFSFKVDLGISLLEEVLQMLREQFPKYGGLIRGRTQSSRLLH